MPRAATGQRRRSKPVRPSRMGSQRRRHAARLPDRLHLGGARVREVDLGVANALLAGWNVSGVLRYESGRPFNITMSNDLGGLLFNGQKRPNRVSGVDAVASRSGGFDPNVDRYFNPAAWTDPGPLHFGNAVRRDGTVRGFPIYSEDLNIFKVFPMADQSKMRVEASIGNIFNRVSSAIRIRTGVPPASARSTRNVISRGRSSSH